ncbi:cilia- and flagella-associated protein 46 [Nematolebias whitei]|uniref:cilia- and flagella-associated protein 46 n=1 Tax=Nematolebias whitei TaxID=451745 RepID=UPI001899E1F4|nr:cilia- and flagella-associated protein 46 [Nematolebias whitei]
MELDVRQCLSKAKENRDCGALEAAFSLLGGRRQRGASPPELVLTCAETAQQLERAEISAACLNMFFEEKSAENQLVCRAFVCQGQLKAPAATGSVDDFDEAVMCFLKAIEMSKKEPRSHFMVFNASVLYFQTVRPLLQPGRCRHLVPSLKQVVQSLEEVSDGDHRWRAELMIHLVRCLVDSGQVEEAAHFAKVSENFIKTQTPHLYSKLFKLQVAFRLLEDEVLHETSRQNSTLTVIYKMQELKRWSKMNKNVPTGEDSGKFEEILHLLVDQTEATPVSSVQQPTPAPLPYRASFLLELALLALQGKHHKVAAGCLKELKARGEATLDHRLIMECVSCEINFLKEEANMDIYCRASVEARLKEIDKLDQWLQTAAREGALQALQVLSATQWRFCLPLLQQNLRNRIKTPLLRMAQVLEDTQSVLLQQRCHVHSELALAEDEDGNLQASLTHLQKAVSLDHGTHGERLSSSVRLLQLRRNLHQSPPRPEDRAALLLQQARDLPPWSEADTRAVLVSVGLLLAPEDFQMVLDADNTSEILVGSPGPEPVDQLAAKVQHHTARVQQAAGHLDRRGKDTDSPERVQLWATLAKTARKQEVWDVCRAACRFCLLYDDGTWKSSKTAKCKCSEEQRAPEQLCCCSATHVHVLRLLAEVCFINAEATIDKLLSEGVQLSGPAVRPQEGGFSEQDPNWLIYRDWIQALSADATGSFLRAAELGAAIQEQWVLTNSAVYLWNYNNHLLAAGEYRVLLPTFQKLLGMLQKSENTSSTAVCVLMSSAVARGLIQPLSEWDGAESAPKEPTGPIRERGVEKTASVHRDPAALQDVHKALEQKAASWHHTCNSTAGSDQLQPDAMLTSFRRGGNRSVQRGEDEEERSWSADSLSDLPAATSLRMASVLRVSAGIVRTCVHLGLEDLSPNQELLNLIQIPEEEQIESHKAMVISQKRRSLHTSHDQSMAWRPDKDVTLQDLWLDKAEVCLDLDLLQPARQLLAEAHMVAAELRDKNAVSRSLLILARLACMEQNFSEALMLLDKAQTLGRTAEFWYQLTLIRVTAVVGQGDPDSQTRVDRVVHAGCEALQLLQTQHTNRAPQLSSVIASLRLRFLLFCPGHGLSLAATRRLTGLRFCLAELSLDVLEERCAVEIHQALSRAKKTSVEIKLEEFTRSSPEPGSTEQEWVAAGHTLGQVVLSQLAAVSLQSSDNMEVRARCLCLTGKYLRLLAVHEEPVHVRDLWDAHTQETCSGSEGFLTADSETDGDYSRNKWVVTSAGNPELQIQGGLSQDGGGHVVLETQAFRQLTISPNHLSILSEIPPKMKVLLLQHSTEGSKDASSLDSERTKEDKSSSDKAEPEEYLVLLADRKLLELPLESLSVLQGQGPVPVTRDFSLQIFYNRLNREAQKAESDNTKETKGGKAAKGRRDQSQSMKAVPANPAVPSSTFFTVDSRGFRFIVDPHIEGRLGGTGLSRIMKEVLQSQNLSHLWEGGSDVCSGSDPEQVLLRCSIFVFLGRDSFLASVPPAKLAVFNLSGTVLFKLTFIFLGGVEKFSDIWAAILKQDGSTEDRLNICPVVHEI